MILWVREEERKGEKKLAMEVSFMLTLLIWVLVVHCLLLVITKFFVDLFPHAVITKLSVFNAQATANRFPH